MERIILLGVGRETWTEKHILERRLELDLHSKDEVRFLETESGRQGGQSIEG